MSEVSFVMQNFDSIFEAMYKIETINQANEQLQKEHNAENKWLNEQTSLPDCLAIQLVNNQKLLYDFLKQFFNISYNEKQYQLIFGITKLSDSKLWNTTIWENYRDQYLKNLIYSDMSDEVLNRFVLPYGRNPFHYYMMFRCVDTIEQLMTMPRTVTEKILRQKDAIGFTPLDYFFIYLDNDNFPHDDSAIKQRFSNEFILDIKLICSIELLLHQKIELNYKLGSFSAQLHYDKVNQIKDCSTLQQYKAVAGDVVNEQTNTKGLLLDFTYQDFKARAAVSYSLPMVQNKIKFPGEKNLRVLNKLVDMIQFGQKENSWFGQLPTQQVAGFNNSSLCKIIAKVSGVEITTKTMITNKK